MTTAVFPGSFDPITLGHLDIIKRASTMFEKLIVAVFEPPEGKCLFSTEERMVMASEATSQIPNVKVEKFQGLIVDFAHNKGAQVMLRGLRLNTDFEYEFEMALMNRNLAPDLDVVCLITSLQYQYVRSSLIKEVASLKGDISQLVPDGVSTALAKRFGSPSHPSIKEN